MTPDDIDDMPGAAQHLARLGWPVLPIKAMGKIPLTAHGVNDATTDPQVIRGWFARWPDCNLGVATGAPGPTVLDIDRPADAVHLLEQIRADHPPEVATARGRHLYFAGTDRGTVNLEFGELRGRGSYVVVPPSIHETGRSYVWLHAPGAVLPAVPAVLVDAGVTAGAGTMPARPRIPVGGRHDHLKDLATRLVRSGVTDPATIERHLRAEYEAVCDPVPPPRRDEFANLARWAAGTRIAARERMPNGTGLLSDRAAARLEAQRVIDEAGGWSPRRVKRVVREGVRLVDAMYVHLDDGSFFDFPRQGDITSRLWGRTVTSHMSGLATPAAMKDPALADLFKALCLFAAPPAGSKTEADEVGDILAGMLAIAEPMTGYSIEDQAGRYRLIAALRARMTWDPSDRQSLQQPPLVIDQATGCELLRAGDVWTWFRHRGAGLTLRELPGRLGMVGVTQVRAYGRAPRDGPGSRPTNRAVFYELPTKERDDMTDQPQAPEPAEPDPEAPTQTELGDDQPAETPAEPAAEPAETPAE